MAVGTPVDKDGLDYALGLFSNQLRAALENAESIASLTSGMQQTDLEAWGYSTDEAYLIKLMMEDANKVKAIRALYDAQFNDLKKFMGLPTTTV